MKSLTVHRTAHRWLTLVVLLLLLSIRQHPIGAQATSVPATPIPVTPSPLPTLAPINLTSVVTSGTAGAALPIGQVMALHVFHYDSNGIGKEYVTQNVSLPADGTLKFAPFQGQLGDICVITTDYQGTTQGSAPLVLSDPAVSTISLPVSLYQATHDSTVLQITQDKQIISFLSATLMTVLETVTWTNTSDRLYLSSDKTANGKSISINFPLPIGARTIAFNSQPLSRFMIGGDANAPVIEDTAPVIPKLTHQIVFSFQIPYPGGAFLDRTYPVAVASNSVQILLPDDTGVQFAGDAASTFASAPDTADAQRPYTAYTLTAPVTAQGRVVFNLSGTPDTFTNVVTAQSTPAHPPPIPLNVGLIVAVIGAVLVVLLLVWDLRRRALRQRPGRHR